MSTLTCLENYIDKEKNHYSCFLIEPLEIGNGITIGNSLRRTLLSDLTGFSVIGVRINNLKHEFDTVPGLREDVLEVILNLKEIVFKTSFVFPLPEEKEKSFRKFKGFLLQKGPLILTAGMFQLPKNSIQILNPNQYIGTIVDTSEIYLEIDIEHGKGYRLAEENLIKEIEKKNGKNPTTLFVDGLFMPIKRVNYKIKLIHDTKGNIKESLIFEIWTNGSITPKRSLQESLKLLLNLYYPLFLTKDFFSISSIFANKYFAKKILKQKLEKIKRKKSKLLKKSSLIKRLKIIKALQWSKLSKPLKSSKLLKLVKFFKLLNVRKLIKQKKHKEYKKNQTLFLKKIKKI
jgi:DNA-directed RNA polymerase alpha subunit